MAGSKWAQARLFESFKSANHEKGGHFDNPEFGNYQARASHYNWQEASPE